MNNKFTKLMAALALLACLTIPLGMWGQTTVTYSQTSTSAVSVSFGTAPGGSTASFQNTYTNDKCQLTANNSMTLTLSGYKGYKITGITLSMKSNSSKGAGSLSVVAGSTTIASIADSKFNTENWYGQWSTSYVDINVTMSNSSYEIQEDEDVVITIAASENSLYCQSFKLTYEAVSGGGVSSQTLTFPFTSNISGWPTTNESTLTEHTYTLNNVNYTFALKNVKCNAGYLMCTTIAVLGLPAIENYKLTKVVASNSSGCSTSTKVGISSSSSSDSYISGGALQTWSTTGSSYTYNLSSTEANTMYYLYVTNKNAQVVGLELTYEYVAPSAVATPTFNIAGGYYVGTQNVTISCETSGATIYYTTDGTTPSASNGTQGTSVSISATTTLKAIAVKDEDNSSVAEATYTILTPLTTMQEIYDAATSTGNTEIDVAITFNGWVISDINNSNYKYATKAWLTDGTKGCVIYCTSASYSKFMVNDKLSGTVLCKLKLNTGYAQISSLVSGNDGTTVTPGLTVTHDGTVTPVTDATITGLSAVNTGSVVAFTGLTCQSSQYNYSTGYTLTDGTNTIYVKRNVYSFELTNGTTYNVTGVFENNTTGKFIYPRSAADIVEVVSTDPTISVSPTSLTGFTYAEGSGPSAVQTITVSGVNLEENIALALNDGENSAFEISLSENSGYANTLNLTQANGTVAGTTIYVRMKAGLAIANNYEDEINLTSTNAIAKTVSLAGTVTGPEFTWDLTTATYNSASTEQVQWTNSYATMTVDKNGASSNANAYLNTGTPVTTRFYTGQKLTFAPKSGYTIDHVEITGTSSNVAGIDNNAWVNAASSTSGTTVTITPTDNSKPFYDIISATVRLTSVTVYYAVSTDPFYTITIDDDINNGTVLADYDQATEGTIVTLTINPNTGYYLKDSDLMVLDENLDDVDVTKVNGVTYTFEMPADNVTVYASFSVYTGTYYTLVTNTADLVTGRHYIIASSKTPGSAYAMGAQNDNKYREQVAVDVVNNMIYGTENVHEIVLSGDANNYWTLYDEETPGYLHAYNSASNQLGTRQSNATNENYGQWAININEGVATIVSQVGAYGFSNTIKYNSTNTRFSCYTASSTMALVYLYMKANETDYELYSNTTFNDLTIGELDIYTVHSPAILNVTGNLTNSGNYENLVIEDGAQLITSSSNVAATVQKNIAAHGATVEDGGWNFIASPITYPGISPADAGLITDNLGSSATSETATYDLYKFEEHPDDGDEWRNYRIEPFNLDNTEGYLYANKNTITLNFTGNLKSCANRVTVGLAYYAPAELAGWNLVGNPFPCNAEVTTYSSSSCYKVSGGSIVAATSSVIGPCCGAMVKATYDGDNAIITPTTESVSFSTGHQLNLFVANEMTARGERSMIDNAIVSFNENSQLEKFVFFEDNAKLYIPQNGKDFAIAYSEGQGEMPVNFKATKNGTYTLTVNPEGVDLNYLHLIDNMTGMDVDLLQTPSYTFEASTRDYESRFKLVFAGASTDSATDESFAYYDGSEWKVSNEGEATLQVVDVLGRIVKSESINGNFSLNLNQKAGVYMLRLINGENVKVQKVVVR